MKFINAVFILIIITLFNAQAQNNYPVPFYSKGFWGFSEYNHKIIINPKYEAVDIFHDGLAWVTLNEKCGFIDSTGNEVIPLKFKTAENFSKGYSMVSIDEKYAVIDTKGNFVIPLSDNYISWFNGEVAGFSVDYIYGLMAKNGKIILPAEYPKLDKFTENIFVFAKYKDPSAFKLDKMGLVNSKGEIILTPKYDVIYPIPGGFAKIMVSELWGLIDSTGKELVPPLYTEIRNPKQDGYVGFKKDDLWGIMKFDGTITVEPKYHDLGQGNSYFDEVFDLTSDGFKVNLNGNHGIVDGYGKEIIPIKYYMLGYTSNGITSAYFKIDTSESGLPLTGLTLIDSLGKEIIPPNSKYNNVGQYSEGLIAVGIGDNWGTKWNYIDLTGKQSISETYEEAGTFENGMAIVKKDGKYAVIDKSGNQIIMYQESEIKRPDAFPGLFQMMLDGVNVYYDSKGICFCK